MKQSNLTDTEMYIWDYINEHVQNVAQLTISELSELLAVSNASITRTLKKRGYSGFTAFKHDIQIQSKNQLQILSTTKLSDDAKQSILKNYQEVIRTLNMIDAETLESSIKEIQRAQRVVIFARGFSEMIASEMLIKFQLAGKYCELHTDPNIIRPVSTRLSTNDLVVLISLNGETKALVDAALNCKKMKIPSILISASQSSSLAQLATHSLFAFKSELSYFPDFEVHSRLPLSLLSRILLDAYAAGNRTI